MDWKKRMLVVAIDFGTTYSGYASSFRSDYKSSPTKVTTLTFEVGSTHMPKMPTSVLFTPDKEFHSFGVEAEEKYARLYDDDKKEARRWYFFQRFKLNLHNNKTLDRHSVLADDTKKKEMPALDVFSAAIGYLKKHFTDELQKRGSYVPASEITWVLTVPAIWDDGAKDFMREAAQEAGIPGDQLELALEPEAASVSCLEHYRSSQSLSRPADLYKPGKRFLLADCGGGTIDISAFEVQGGNRLKHLHRPDGTCQGGTKVDDAFKEFLHDLLGVDGLASIDKLELHQLMLQFETVKRTQSAAEKIAIKMPSSIKLAVEEAIKTCRKKDAKSHKYHGKVSITRNNLMLDRDIFLSFFQASAASIPASIKEVLDNEKVRRVDAILLAGGFSESDVIQEAVKKAFPRDLVLVAPSPSAAVLTGAVMFGHNPDVIATRVSAYTYGVNSQLLFEDGVHDVARLVVGEDGDILCDDCFDVHITIDQEVEVNKLLPHETYNPATSDQTEVQFDIYRSTNREPLYVDEEGSEKIGTVTVLMPDTTGGVNREIKAAMMVGGTELKFFATDKTTGEEFTTKCDFLSKN